MGYLSENNPRTWFCLNHPQQWLKRSTMAMTEHAGDRYGGNGNYTYILRGIPDYANSANPQYPTRHRAVGEKAILEAIHLCDIEIVARERHATDPANNVNVLTPCEVRRANREAAD